MHARNKKERLKSLNLKRLKKGQRNYRIEGEKMPFKRIELKSVVGEKRQDKEFDEAYTEVEREYELIRKVVEARKNKGMTQKNLAEVVGVSQQEISRFEREKHIPKLSNFIKILDALELELKIEDKHQTQ